MPVNNTLPSIVTSIQARSKGVLDLKDAALYQALHRMERAGWIDAEWGVSERGKRAKYYRLTATGKRQLKEEAGFWRKYATAVASILEPLPERG